MESISLREFQLNAGKYLGKEITLTRYNIPIAVVTPITVGALKKIPNSEDVPVTTRKDPTTERHPCSWDRTFKCTSPGIVLVKGKWWCAPHSLEV